MLEWHVYYKSCLKRLITFASPQPADRGFLGGVCMHYRSLALIPGSCVSRRRGSLVHTVCIHTVLGFLGLCKMFFVTLLNFVSHLILPKKKNPVLYIFTVVQAPNLVRQMLTVGWAPWQVS